MIPNFTFLGKTFSAYMFLALAGVLVMLYFAWQAAKSQGLDELHMLNLLLFSMIGVLVGSHMLYGITNLPLLLALVGSLGSFDSWKAFWQALEAVFGGAVFYGGLLGGLAVGYVFLRKSRLDVGRYSDVAAPAIALFHTFGRLGCFLSGCCYGVPWSHGITYHYAAMAEANGVARFPVQLVEAGLNFGLFFLLWTLLRKRRLPGRLLLLYLLIYPTYRFFLEFLRGDAIRGFLLGLSTSQVISLLLLAGSALIWLRCRRTQA